MQPTPTTHEWDPWQEIAILHAKYGKEFSPMFARIGESPELVQRASSLRADFLRRPPSKPQKTGQLDLDRRRRDEFRQEFSAHYEQLFHRTENLLSQAWPHEARFMAKRIEDELANLRHALVREPSRVLSLDILDKLLASYIALDELDPRFYNHKRVQHARRQMAEVLGFPLMVRAQLQHPEWDLLPPIASDEFKTMLETRLGVYEANPWLQTKIYDTYYLSLSFDVTWAHMRRDSSDRRQILGQLKLDWPKLSQWYPSLPYGDLVWYMSLVMTLIGALICEWWWLSGALFIWLHLSLIVERSHVILMSQKRQALLLECGRFKNLRDLVNSGKCDVNRLLRLVKRYDLAEQLPVHTFPMIRRLAISRTQKSENTRQIEAAEAAA